MSVVKRQKYEINRKKKVQNAASNSDLLVGVRALNLDTTKSALRRNRAIIFPSPTPLQAPMTYAWVCHALFYDKIVLFKYREDPGCLFGVCFHNSMTIFHMQLCRCDCYVPIFKYQRVSIDVKCFEIIFTISFTKDSSKNFIKTMWVLKYILQIKNKNRMIPIKYFSYTSRKVVSFVA